MCMSRASRTRRRGVLHNFFEGSREKLIASLLDGGAGKLTPEELDSFSDLIERARMEGQ